MLLQEVRNHEGHIEILEREFKVQKEQTDSLEKGMLAENMGDINVSEEYDYGHDPQEKTNTGKMLMSNLYIYYNYRNLPNDWHLIKILSLYVLRKI